MAQGQGGSCCSGGVGSQSDHDHGRVGFRIISEDVSEGNLKWAKSMDTLGPPRYTMEWWRSKDKQICDAMKEKIKEVQRKMGSGQMSLQELS